jgi:enoyl-CoA hydratase/carnithine racemase
VTEFETLIYEERAGVAYVTLNRPEAHNAFNFLMRQELQRMWGDLRRNDDVRVVVLTGAGEKAFCSGIDRFESMGEDYKNGVSNTQAGHVSTPVMFDDPGRWINPKQNDMWKPVIAAVNGMACAGALYMLGEADIIIAAEHATFFDPHVTFGMVASFESMHLLQKLPLGETLRLALLGSHERMSAQRAHQVGLVSEVVPLADLMSSATWAAEAIASAPAAVTQATVQAAWTAHDNGRKVGLSMAHAFVALGTERENILEGQEKFGSGDRIQWRLR